MKRITLRVDQALVDRGFVVSRTAAQRLIYSGRVFFAGAENPFKKASQWVDVNDVLEIRKNLDDHVPDEDRYVSRGGLKLAGALSQSKIDPIRCIALDVGLSTGGFSDCLLQAGAKRVIGIDVGHGQLHEKLAFESRLCSLEGINARYITRGMLDAKLHEHDSEPLPEAGFSLIVGDVSFISLALILPALTPLLSEIGDLLMLVKPQFEVGRAYIGRGGVVRDSLHYGVVEEKLRRVCEELGLKVQAWLDSPIVGGDGNREFFIHAKHGIIS
ncbi:TlyA family RNA methyltransferase [Candidatus Pandoraea novymonadis]|uniref:Hemolysin A n=1 Tax=Candidatus Pandoraea novymonadis TaxID=1808959 RepID=A0ABX5FEQ0_9BURK|nr:TlyA family RNA methyltransferase [Candidatus Pandoraea novymonadis]PSB91627.1 Hemolysin A [Candidatus Pandoraea novymonadis]